MAMKEFIGVFDSGMGGVTVLADLIKALPDENFIYCGDSANAPYGTKTLEEVAALTEQAVSQLIEEGAKLVVIACNTATSAAVEFLREKFEVPIVGMEPAIKPAVEANQGGHIAVMATPMTLELDKFNHLMNRLQGSGQIVKVPSPALVEYVEQGIYKGGKIEMYFDELFEDLKPGSVESVVLGCTHFLYLKEALYRYFGQSLKIFDGNQGTVNRVVQILSEKDLETQTPGGEVEITNTASEEMAQLSRSLLKIYSEMEENLRQSSESRELKEEKVREMVMASTIDDRYKEMILVRYGVDSDHALTAEEFGKKYKLRGKKLKEELLKVERLAFNILKTESIYDIISQN